MATKTKAAAAKRQENAPSGFKVKLDRLFAEGHRPLAVFSADNGQFAVHGIQVVHSKNGPFVQMPQTSYTKQGETVYKDIFHPISAESRQELYGAVMEQYEQARIKEAQQEARAGFAVFAAHEQAQVDEAQQEDGEDELPEQGPGM